MIDVLGCGDPSENVMQTVSNTVEVDWYDGGSDGHGLSQYVLRGPYILVCVC